MGKIRLVICYNINMGILTIIISLFCIGTGTFALGVMLFTNVLLDAPITTALTNKLLASDKSLNKKQLEVRA